ncbi:hypothetical protein, partial [Bacillus sp. JCM 19034]|uniref:hypothetical protein n=1 Tax=Bacillus sp. JCM 19034 TaxID=1481928 RepID=UPI001E477367
QTCTYSPFDVVFTAISSLTCTYSPFGAALTALSSLTCTYYSQHTSTNKSTLQMTSISLIFP